MDRIVQAVADDAQWQAQLLGASDEGDETWIDLHLVQMGIKRGRIQFQQPHLALHAFTRADLSRLPLVFQFLPARLAVFLQQRVDDIFEADGAVEVTQDAPVHGQVRR